MNSAIGLRAIDITIGWATDNYETLIEVDEVIESLRKKHPDLTYIRMGCANDHPDFLKMAAEWVQPQIEALLSTSPAQGAPTQNTPIAK